MTSTPNTTAKDTRSKQLDLNETALIVSAAVLHNGIIHSMPRPKRHADIVHAMNIKIGDSPLIHAKGEQGFLDGDGRFYGWEDAAKVAEFWSQLQRPLIAPPKLYMRTYGKWSEHGHHWPW